MDPATVSVAVALAPYALAAVKWGGALVVGLLVHRNHNQTVQAVAQTGVQAAQVAAEAAAKAAVGTMLQGGSGKDATKAAGTAAIGAAIAALGTAADGKPILGPPAPLGETR